MIAAVARIRRKAGRRVRGKSGSSDHEKVLGSDAEPARTVTILTASDPSGFELHEYASTPALAVVLIFLNRGRR
jgi:hypothetical protein